MGFWIFMLWMNLLLPIMMLLFGWIFLKHPPKDINSIYGYRTSRSKASQEAWDFAHRYFGKWWFYGGFGVAVVSIVGMLPLLGKSVDVIGTYGAVVCTAELFLMLFPILPTEHALKKKFGDTKKKRKN
ncbi:MAG: SdpI family protein [Roseburia sp.]